MRSLPLVLENHILVQGKFIKLQTMEKKKKNKFKMKMLSGINCESTKGSAVINLSLCLQAVF